MAPRATGRCSVVAGPVSPSTSLVPWDKSVAGRQGASVLPQGLGAVVASLKREQRCWGPWTSLTRQSHRGVQFPVGPEPSAARRSEDSAVGGTCLAQRPRHCGPPHSPRGGADAGGWPPHTSFHFWTQPRLFTTRVELIKYPICGRSRDGTVSALQSPAG